MIKIIQENSVQLIEICKKHQVDALFLFGSAAKGNFNSNSDLDFLVQFNPGVPLMDYADNYFSLADALEFLFKSKIDLLSLKSLKNKILKQEIEKTKISLYAA
jgi:predicted nucleotidyltransferase